MAIINGTPGDDIDLQSLIDQAGDDSLFGFAGGDWFFMYIGGTDLVDGSSGDDAVLYSGYDGGLQIDLEAGKAVDALGNVDTLISIEGANGSDYADYVKLGNGGGWVFGGAGNDFLVGGSGDDWFSAGSGNDTINGGDGENRVSYEGDSVLDGLTYDPAGFIIHGVSVALAKGTVIDGWEGTDTLISIQHVSGSQLDDQITGNAGANWLTAGNGNDIVDGAAGDDHVEGELGQDTLSGSDGDDEIHGDAGNDILDGGAGSDILIGGLGADIIYGMSGEDFYTVDRFDVIFEVGGGRARDTVSSSESFSLADSKHVKGDVEDLILTGLSRANGTGNALANAITGNAAANVLNGMLGKDTLIGGGGNDYFVFNTKPSSTNVDRIADFHNGKGNNDVIQLENAVFTKLGGNGALKAGFFHAGTAAADADDHIIHNIRTGALYYDSDGNGKLAQVLFATLNHIILTASDFSVV